MDTAEPIRTIGCPKKAATLTGKSCISQSRSSVPGTSLCEQESHFMKILVRDEREPELWATSNDTSWTAFEERLEAFFLVCKPYGDQWGYILFVISLTDPHERIRHPLVSRLSGTCLHLQAGLDHI